MERKIKLEDADLRSYVEQKFLLVNEGRELQKQAEEMEAKHSELLQSMRDKAEEIDKLKVEKIIPRVKDLVDSQLAEYEVAITTDIQDGQLFVTIQDLVEIYKEQFKGFDKWKQAAPIKNKEDK